MTAHQVAIRDGVYDAIVAAANDYVINYADVEKTYYPQENLESLESEPKIKVIAIGYGSSRMREYRAAGTVLLDVPVQIAIQRRVNPTDTATIDELVLLIEQVMNTCEDDELVAGEDYTWDRTDPLKDDNDLIYSYEQLTVEGVFQAVFTVHYQYVKQSA